jgi:hypothetical protein
VKGVRPESDPQPRETEFWDRADPLIIGAGETEGALLTSANRHPGVEDSIEQDDDVGVTRRASENTTKVLGEYIPDQEDSSRVWSPT